MVAPVNAAPAEPLEAEGGDAAAEQFLVQDDVSCDSSVVDDEYVLEHAPGIAEGGDVQPHQLADHQPPQGGEVEAAVVDPDHGALEGQRLGPEQALGPVQPPLADGGRDDAQPDVQPPAANAPYLPGGLGQGQGPRAAAYPREEVPGLGHIVWNAATESLAAVCKCGHDLCRTSRTLKPNDHRPSQARPLGFLMAWLRAGPECPNDGSHQVLARRESAHDPRVSYQERVDAREWLEAQPNFRWLRELERPVRPDEGAEPLLVTY